MFLHIASPNAANNKARGYWYAPAFANLKQKKMEKLEIKNLEYAYCEEGITPISIASKDGTYYLDKERTIKLTVIDEYVRQDGVSVVKHYKRHASTTEQAIADYIRSNESIEHLNAKRRILSDCSVTINGCPIKAHSVALEVRFEAVNRIVDAVLYDSEGGILLAVEVYHTHRKSKEDIEKLKELNIPIYEQDINDTRRSKFICFGASASAFKGLEEEEQALRRRTERARGIVSGDLGRYQELRERDTKRRAKCKSYFSDKETAKQLERDISTARERIEDFRSGRTTERECEEIKQRIEYYNRRAQEAARQIGDIKRAIEQIKESHGLSEEAVEYIVNEYSGGAM